MNEFRVDMPGGFPAHDIDPSKKGKEWIRQFIKAAWDDYRRRNARLGFNDKYRIDVLKAYASGAQSIQKYKPLLNVDEDSNETYLNIDWSILPIVKKFRRIAVGRMMNNEYNITATPVDPMAQDDTTAFFAEQKAKVLMRELMMQQNPELLQAPAMQQESGDPEDMEELEMQAAYTYKHQAAMEAEMGIQLVFNQNDITECRKRVFEELFDVGYAGYREYIDESDVVLFRAIRPDNLVVSFCRNADFSDKFYAGEIIELTIADLRKVAGNQFSEDDYKEIAKKVQGEYGNPNTLSDYYINYSYGYDRYKIRILDIEFYSVNSLVAEERIDRRGNLVFGRAPYGSRNNVKEKYKRTDVKVVYKGKWIIGTEYLYDFGLCTDMKRQKSSKSDTPMSFHIRASDFYDMRAVGKMEEMMPIADAIQLAWYKLQNAINQAVPGAWDIDLDGLEDVAIGSGGKKMEPMQLLDMFFQKNILVSRRRNAMGQNVNYKSIDYIQNGSFQEVKVYWDLIQSYIETLRQITGLNELTDGSTPNERTLTTVAKMAGESTNNALSDIVYAERRLLETLAGAVLLRLQDVIKRSEVSGYVKALGTGTINFFKMSPETSFYEMGIQLEDRPTVEQRVRLLQQLDQYRAAGLLEPEDDFLIEQTQNMKQAQQILAYKVKKRKKEQQDQAMQQQQMNGQIQIQSTQAAEQAKQQSMQMEYQLKAQLEEVKINGQMQLLQMKLQAEGQNTAMREQSRVEAATIQADSKKPPVIEEELFQMEEME